MRTIGELLMITGLQIGEKLFQRPWKAGMIA